MQKQITTLFTDLGGTLRIVHKDPAYQMNAMRRIAELVGTDMEPEAFHRLLDERYDGYRDWALLHKREAPEAELWMRWLAFDYPKERVAKHSEELTYEYRKAKGRRLVVDHGLETLKTLDERGYRIGIISDLIGTREIPEWLHEDHLAEFFCAVQLSSVCCIRKPDTEIYFRACREAGTAPGECAFVGDNLNRDIIGAKRAGFGLTIAVEHPGMPKLKLTSENRPDVVIHAYEELLNLFPKCPMTDLTRVETL